MSWIIAFIIGLVVGVIAKFLMPGKDPGGFIITGLLGIGGSLLASWAGSQLGLYQQGQTAGFIASVVGAMVLLGIYRMVKGGGAKS
jgi:uncharacterized membrane protein YeaQ/YmgE (transglycosylase-associated protein family)